MHIYLVRHTEYYNPDNIFPFHLPVYLSVNGRKHAQRIAEWFKARKLLHLPIYSSPIVRCVQSSEIIAAQTSSMVNCDDRLIEDHSPGIQGTVQPKKDAWKVEEADEKRETHEQVRERTVSFYEEKIKKGEDCIAVSHGEPLTVLYYHLIKKPLPQHLWSPENDDKVIHRGEIIDVEIVKNQPPILTLYQV